MSGNGRRDGSRLPVLSDEIREVAAGVDDARILAHRPRKEHLDPFRPYHHLHEEEPGADGRIRRVNTIFLTNRECPFRCVMCDLWRHTLDEPTPEGAIPAQIRWALERLPEADVVKLYNNGNFFDPQAIRPEEYAEITGLLGGFERVIVENHPRISGDRIFDFQERIAGTLEIALGVESVHPEVLPRLNKRVTLDEIAATARRFRERGIDLRAFVLLNPPYLTDPAENHHWCLESVRFAFEHGFGAVAIIPVRTGNGIMEVLEAKGAYVQPTLSALEAVFDDALALGAGRVFADCWDLERFVGDPATLPARRARLKRMNLQQRVLPQ
jgi:archaeosine synthase beta-subunit